jgi:hypothetical protein
MDDLNTPGELDAGDETLLAALLSESTYEAAAVKAGVSTSTVWRRLRDPRFKAAYREAGQRIVGSAVLNLQKACGEAVEVLRLAMMGDNPATAVRAAQLVLEKAFAGAELLNLAERVEELEALIKKGTP